MSPVELSSLPGSGRDEAAPATRGGGSGLSRMAHRPESSGDHRYALTDSDNRWTEHGFDMRSDALADTASDHEGDE